MRKWQRRMLGVFLASNPSWYMKFVAWSNYISYPMWATLAHMLGFNVRRYEEFVLRLMDETESSLATAAKM